LALFCACGVQPGYECFLSRRVHTLWLRERRQRSRSPSPFSRTFAPDPHNRSPRTERRGNPRLSPVWRVHLYGPPADMYPMLASRSRARLPLIETIAQALCASYKAGRPARSETLRALSFIPTITLGAYGTPNGRYEFRRNLGAPSLAFRNTAIGKYLVSEPAGTSASRIQAAILRVKLRHLSLLARCPPFPRRGITPTLRADSCVYALLFAPDSSTTLHTIHYRIEHAMLPEIPGRTEKNRKHGLLSLSVCICNRSYASLGHKARDFPAPERGAQNFIAAEYPELARGNGARGGNVARNFWKC